MEKLKKILLISFIISPLWMMAQKEGTIVYTESVSFDIEAPEGMEEMFKDMPKSRSSEKSLIFSNGKSLYKIVKSMDYENEGVVESGSETSVFKIKVQEPDNRTFTDHSKKKVVVQEELMGKPFLIKDDIKKFDWKVSSERRQILDHQCMKATVQVDDKTITAWFSLTIPVGIGPDEYNGLPGAILMIETEDGKREIVAKSINMDAIDMSEMIVPEKGKKVNRERFEAIRKEKMDEMESVHGGTGVRMIIRN